MKRELSANSVGQSTQPALNQPTGFRLRLGWKDVRLVLELGQDSETPMPIGSLLRDRFLSALAKGRGDLD